MKNNHFYVTTPLYYVNSKPHLGTLYSTLIADVTARFKKLMAKEVFFLTGTDEHGQKIAEKAKSEGLDPKTFVDSMIDPFKETWKLYEIEYDKFIRTTDKQHTEAVLKFVNKLQEQGDIYKSTYEGWYCVPCETFVTINKDVPKDNNGYLCPSCKRALKDIEEENYFFRLSAYEDRLIEFYEENKNFIFPKERANEVTSFLKSGLEDLSISRKGVKWGIPFPGDAKHTIYVWADALINYISAVGYGDKKDDLDKWWPANLHIMAKDIVRFHGIYWPAFLMAAELPLPQCLYVHGYILSGESKMSKSLGNVVDPKNLADAYGVESVRYYLMRQMSAHQDGKFDINELENRIASDLANNLGNLLNRTISLAISNGLTEVKPLKALEPNSTALHVRCEEAFRDYWDSMSHYEYHVALGDLWKFISEVNAYFNNEQPWKVAKENKEFFEEIISSVCHCLYTIAILAWPVMPKKMEELLKCLGHKLELGINYEGELRKNLWNKIFKLSKSKEPLFIRPERKPVEEEKKTEEITLVAFDDFVKTHLVVGEIVACEFIVGSEKLYKMSVDLGSYGKRQILAGVAKFFQIEDLLGKQGVFVANLPSRKMMGLASEGMMLMAKDDEGRPQPVRPVGSVENGTRLS